MQNCFFTEPILKYYNNSFVSTEFHVCQRNNHNWHRQLTVDDQTLSHMIASMEPPRQLKYHALTINCADRQFVDPQMADTFIKFQHRVYPLILSLEVTITDDINKDVLAAQSENYSQHGIRTVLDHVEQFTTLQAINNYIDYIREIKFELTNSVVDPLLISNWQDLAQKHQLRFTVTNIATQSQFQMLAQQHIEFMQGTFIGEAAPLTSPY